MDAVLRSRYDDLQAGIRCLGSVVVGYSGGVDSVLLARVAHDVLGDRMMAVIADSPSLPRRELREAIDLAHDLGLPVERIPARELEDPRYRANPADRCYYCRIEFFERMRERARDLGFAAVAYGENADDSDDWRPGARAAAEYDVVAPLRDAGLTKDDIRTLSRALGLPTWDKPAMACLASRIPYGREVTLDALQRIENAEEALHAMGAREVRVRDHEGGTARIELGADEIARFIDPGVRAEVVASFRELGYRYVTLDLAGYRRGSLNVVLPAEATAPGGRRTRSD